MGVLREAMAAALRQRREARGLSLEAVARRCNMTKPGVHSLEVGRTGAFLDHMEEVAGALGARWSVALLPADAADPWGELLHAVQAVPAGQLEDLTALVRHWALLTDDDRAVIALLVARRARAAELLPARTG